MSSKHCFSCPGPVMTYQTGLLKREYLGEVSYGILYVPRIFPDTFFFIIIGSRWQAFPEGRLLSHTLTHKHNFSWVRVEGFQTTGVSVCNLCIKTYWFSTVGIQIPDSLAERAGAAMQNKSYFCLTNITNSSAGRSPEKYEGNTPRHSSLQFKHLQSFRVRACSHTPIRTGKRARACPRRLAVVKSVRQ